MLISRIFKVVMILFSLSLLTTHSSAQGQDNDVIIKPISGTPDWTSLLISNDKNQHFGIGLRYSNQENALEFQNWFTFTFPPPIGTVTTYQSTPILRIQRNGYVGIYHSLPDARLHINGSGSTNSFRIDYNGLPKFTVHSDGVVSIGSNSSKDGYILNVDGKIATEEVLVQNSMAWPDYVFEDDYSLCTLESVQEFIKFNKHLPGVPPASEINANGIVLGDMQAILLKKIEELTLYILEQEARIKVLEEKLK